MKASPRSVRLLLFPALALGVVVLAISTFVPGGDRGRPEGGEAVERSGGDGQESSASPTALAQPARVESVPEARKTAATHGDATVPAKDVAPPAEDVATAIDDAATIQGLRRRLREMDDEYRRELKLAMRVQSEAVMFFASSSGAVDGSLAKPDEREGEFFIYRTDRNGRHLLRFDQLDFPELFAARRKREELSAAVKEMRERMGGQTYDMPKREFSIR